MKLGDIVQLKSGGPKMTVTRLADTGILECSWFPFIEAHSSVAYFVPEALVLIEEQPIIFTQI